ncbi:MAG: YggT family protein [Gammaproteobacteria bacterium]|nr:YggT family protein [Gammaproteobacteria bacterium]
MNALIFVVDSLLMLAVFAFLLRLMLQVARANFRNPLAQAVVRLTNWLVLPLRRVLPPIGRFDTASLVALVLVQLLRKLLVLSIAMGGVPDIAVLLQVSLVDLYLTVLQFYTFAIIIYALMSFVAGGGYNPAAALLGELCEPLLGPVRRIVPPLAGLDLSPVFVLIGLQALRILLNG